MIIWFYSIASVVLVSLISLIGVFTLALKKERLNKILLHLVSFAAGGLLGNVFIHLIPEAFKELGLKLSVPIYLLFGILLFFILEKILRWRHCHIPTSKNHLHVFATLNLFGDMAHNFIDGLLLGASFLAGIPVGIATTLAIILHEIPQEIGDFGVLLYGGFTVKKAVLFNFLIALTAVLGTIISLLIGSYFKNYTPILLAITAGGFLYIAGSDLIPELQSRCDFKISSALSQLALILLGIGIMLILALLV